MKIAVVIPAYNEATRLGPVLQALPSTIGHHALLPIVVDDGSADATSQIAGAVGGIKVIRHRTNLGKGAAAKTGCDAAYALGADIIILMDADGQHRPEDLERMAEPLLCSTAPRLVVGTRSFSGRMPFAMRLGNYVLSGLGRCMFGIKARDSQSGFRAFASKTYPSIRWEASQYAMETEMLILAAHHRLEIAEVAIETIYQDNYKGTTPLDGLRIVKTLIKWRLPWYQAYNSLESSSL